MWEESLLNDSARPFGLSCQHIAYSLPLILHKSRTWTPNVGPEVPASSDTGDAAAKDALLLHSIRPNINLSASINASNSSTSIHSVTRGAFIAELVYFYFVFKIMITPAASCLDSSILVLVMEIQAVILEYGSYAPD